MSEWEEYESGPFCRHWDDPSCCTEVCVCGHRCIEHVFTKPGECDRCECNEWRENDHPQS